MRLQISQALVVKLSRMETVKHRLGDKTHLDQEPFPCCSGQHVEFRRMRLAQEERVSTKELKVSAHDVPGVQLGYEMTIATLVDLLDSVTDEAGGFAHSSWFDTSVGRSVQDDAIRCIQA